MKSIILVLVGLILSAGSGFDGTRAGVSGSETPSLKVILLGTGGGPPPNNQRYGISTLIVAGEEKLMFDCGRASTLRMNQLGIHPGEITKLFLTHLHSDHIIGIPDLYLTGFGGDGRTQAFHVWGPEGTRAMMGHLQKAFAFDIHIRRDIDEKFAGYGMMAATDIRQGVVYEANDVKVTAFLVDHGPIKPAFGYRVDYHGHSVVMSGDTAPSDNLIKFAQGVDLLVHEVGSRPRHDPAFDGPPNERIAGEVFTRAQLRAITAHHTDPVEAGQVFARVIPNLAVFSHGGTPAVLPQVRQNYAGPVEIGEDMMTIEIGDKIDVRRFHPSTP
jgi:ribonuclease Z